MSQPRIPFRPLRQAAPGGRDPEVVATVAQMPGFLSPEECGALTAMAQARPGFAGTLDAAGQRDEPIRRSTVRFLYPGDDTEWLFARLDAAVARLNASYGFALEGFAEGVQVASYAGGGHYDWHIDLGPGPFARRKLSLSVQLSPEADYEGGELEFLVSRDRAQRAQGTLIAFPSFLAHRVRPVSRGTRWSLVSWISGMPFR